jgi:hypothetical protein
VTAITVETMLRMLSAAAVPATTRERTIRLDIETLLDRCG